MYSLLDRKTFYPDLIATIKQAKKQIVIDAYIWIDDKIGNKVATALLEAADKGVKIFIRKDLSASMFEHTPKRSPFFVSQSIMENNWKNIWNNSHGFINAKVFNILAFYIYGKKERPKIKKNHLFEKIQQHQNIIIKNFPLFNHGKLILIDTQAYIGGQCISMDYTEWIDYNIKIKDSKVVRNIYTQIKEKNKVYKNLETTFIHNVFSEEKSIHHFLKEFIEEVEEEEELIIEMSYFGRWFIPTIKRALKKGVKIKILASKTSDTNHHTNMWFLADLLKFKSPNLQIFLSERMIHTKGIATNKKMTLGAANLHNACGYFKALNEQNIFSKNPKLTKAILRRFKDDIQMSQEITTHFELPQWKKTSAIIEIIFVYISSYIIFFNKKRIQNWRDSANKELRNIKFSKKQS